jgi:hypothetical protein
MQSIEFSLKHATSWMLSITQTKTLTSTDRIAARSIDISAKLHARDRQQQSTHIIVVVIARTEDGRSLLWPHDGRAFA